MIQLQVPCKRDDHVDLKTVGFGREKARHQSWQEEFPLLKMVNAALLL